MIFEEVDSYMVPYFNEKYELHHCILLHWRIKEKRCKECCDKDEENKK